MAIKPDVNYPGKITPADASYPYGSARNVTVPGDGLGTPLEKAWVNDIFGLFQKLLNAAGVVPSGNAETILSSDYFDSLEKLFSRAVAFDDTGVADAYQLGAASGADPGAYVEGMLVIFPAANTNAGASTVQIAALGAIALELGGGALTGGEVIAGKDIYAIYRAAGPSFDLSSPGVLDGDVTFSKLSTSATEADNVAKRVAKAWVNFNGTGVVAITDSFNVSSITDHGVGDYSVNYTVALANINYCILSSGAPVVAELLSVGLNHATPTKTVNTTRIELKSTGSGNTDSAEVNVAILSS